MSEFARSVQRIQAIREATDYDGRSFLLPDAEPDLERKRTEEYRRGYMCLRYAVAAIRAPGRICEIGVCTGGAALAFLAAVPKAEYVGVDALIEDRVRNINFVERTHRLLISLGYRAEIIVADSQQLDALPGPFDLIHIDGLHTRSGVAHDVKIAWAAASPLGYILVDDINVQEVAEGITDALIELGVRDDSCAYFGEANGSILICKEN